MCCDTHNYIYFVYIIYIKHSVKISFLFILLYPIFDIDISYKSLWLLLRGISKNSKSIFIARKNSYFYQIAQYIIFYIKEWGGYVIHIHILKCNIMLLILAAMSLRNEANKILSFKIITMGTSWHHNAGTRRYYPVAIFTVSSQNKTSKHANIWSDELYVTPPTIVTEMN